MNTTSIIIAAAILTAIGAIFGVVLTFASKAFHVDTDERISKVAENLGGANCGACGYPGCDALAEAIVRGDAPVDACTACGSEKTAAIARIMGVEVAARQDNVARVLCQGEKGIANERYRYIGYDSCHAAAALSGGPKVCPYSCLGLGDCMDACHFGAIRINNGIASIDPDKCAGCGNCAKACPRSVISLMPRDTTVMVRCRNESVARTAREACMKACIGCKKCERTCRYGAIRVENGYASIDREKCTRCGECAAACPCGCITVE